MTVSVEHLGMSDVTSLNIDRRSAASATLDMAKPLPLQLPEGPEIDAGTGRASSALKQWPEARVFHAHGIAQEGSTPPLK